MLGAIFFLASGVLVAVRCSQLTAARSTANGQGESRRFGLAVAGLAIAWITALALIGPLLVDHEIEASQSAAADGNIPSAVNHADTARSIEPWAASPYVQLGLLAQVQGDYVTASGRLSQAIHREDRNWVLYYLRSKIEHEAGDAAGGPCRPAPGPAAEPARELPAGRMGRLRMSRTSGAQRTASRAGTPAAPAPEPRPPASAAGRLGLTGPDGSRRRGAMLRRLLAGGDWVALIGALCVVTATTSTTDVATLFWAVLFSPAWILVDQAPRPLRQRPPADPPQHPRRAALAGLGERARHPRPRRPAGAEPGRPALPHQRDRGRPRRPRSAASSCAACCASSGTA